MDADVVFVAADDLDSAVSVVVVQDICVVAGLDSAVQDIVVVDDVRIVDCHGQDVVFCHHGPAGHKASIFAAVVDYVDCAAWQD